MATVADRVAVFPEDRLPPQNLEAEQGVLGSVLLDSDTMPGVAAILEPGDFYRDSHEAMFRASLAVYDRAGRLDTILLAEELVARGEFDRVGGLEAIEAAVNSVPHAVNAEYYAHIVRQKAVARAGIEACNEALRGFYSQMTSADDALASALSRLMKVDERGMADGAADLEAVVGEALAAIEARRQGECRGVSTGLFELDHILGGGLGNGNLVIVAGRPGMAKTALALNICARAALEGGVASLLFSLEMGKAELGERLLASRSDVFLHKLRDPAAMDDRDNDRLNAAAGRLTGGRLLIDDTSTRTVAQIAALARRYRATHGIGLLAVDYLQLLDGSGDDPRGSSRQEVVARMSRRLKTLARDLDIPVLAMSQLNRECEARADKRPMLSDLRESGAIEQDADVVILLHRPEYYDKGDRPGEAEAIVAKNRHGKTGVVRLLFKAPLGRFEDFAPAPAEPGGEPF